MLADIDVHVAALDRLWTELSAFELPDSRWSRELVDGFASNRLRARYMQQQYHAAIAHLRGDDAQANIFVSRAEATLAAEADVVARRHADLHDTHGRRLVDATTNRTTFQYGYLFYADNLCYWKRELVQLHNLVDGTSTVEPSCFFAKAP